MRLEKVVTIQGDWASGSLSGVTFSVVPFARTDWMLISEGSRVPLRFDRAGRFVAAVGREGGGPGEYGSASHAMMWRGDSVAVFDGINGRINFYDTSGKLARSIRWVGGPITNAIALPDGDFVVSATLRTRSSFGYPLHLFDRNGRLVSSFGSRGNATVRRPSEIPLFRLPTRSNSDGAFFGVEAQRPSVKWFSRRDTVATDDWSLPVKGFRPLSALDSTQGGEFTFIEPVSNELAVAGYWFKARTAARGLGPPIQADGQTAFHVDDWGSYVDTKLLLLDLRRKEVLATAEVDAAIARAIGSDLFWGIEPGGEQGNVTVWRLRIITKSN